MFLKKRKQLKHFVLILMYVSFSSSFLKREKQLKHLFKKQLKRFKTILMYQILNQSNMFLAAPYSLIYLSNSQYLDNIRQYEESQSKNNLNIDLKYN